MGNPIQLRLFCPDTPPRDKDRSRPGEAPSVSPGPHGPARTRVSAPQTSCCGPRQGAAPRFPSCSVETGTAWWQVLQRWCNAAVKTEAKHLESSQRPRHGAAGHGERDGPAGGRDRGRGAHHGLAGRERVRRHAGRVHAHRHLLRVLRAAGQRVRGGLPGGRPEHEHHPRRAVAVRQLHLGHRAAGLPRRGVRVRRPGGVQRAGLPAGRPVPRLPAAARVQEPAHAVPVRVPGPPLQPEGSLHRLLPVLRQPHRVAAHRDLRARPGVRASDQDRPARGGPGGVRRLHLLHDGGRRQGRGVDGRRAGRHDAGLRGAGGRQGRPGGGRAGRRVAAQRGDDAPRSPSVGHGPHDEAHLHVAHPGRRGAAHGRAGPQPEHHPALHGAAQPARLLPRHGPLRRLHHVPQPAGLLLWPRGRRLLPPLRPPHRRGRREERPDHPLVRHGRAGRHTGDDGALHRGRLQRGHELAIHGPQLHLGRGAGGLAAQHGRLDADGAPDALGAPRGGGDGRAGLPRPHVRRRAPRHGGAAQREPVRHGRRAAVHPLHRRPLPALGQHARRGAGRRRGRRPGERDGDRGAGQHRQQGAAVPAQARLRGRLPAHGAGQRHPGAPRAARQLRRVLAVPPVVPVVPAGGHHHRAAGGRPGRPGGLAQRPGRRGPGPGGAAVPGLPAQGQVPRRPQRRRRWRRRGRLAGPAPAAARQEDAAAGRLTARCNDAFEKEAISSAAPLSRCCIYSDRIRYKSCPHFFKQSGCVYAA